MSIWVTDRLPLACALMPRLHDATDIAAECSDDYMKVTIHYNGTFMGLVYSSGYVHDPNCIYVNGTGRNHYEFFIRLNQCGTLGRQEMYHPKRPGEVRVSELSREAQVDGRKRG